MVFRCCLNALDFTVKTNHKENEKISIIKISACIKNGGRNHIVNAVWLKIISAMTRYVSGYVKNALNGLDF